MRVCRAHLSSIFILALFVAASSDLPALDSERNIPQYVHRIWRAEQGLPYNSVYSIRQTHDGYLWIGIEGGLARFDGVRFRIFNKANTPELKHNFIWTLFESKDGSLWIGTEGGGLTQWKDGRFFTWTTKDGLSEDFVRAITEDRNGNIWIGTRGAGLSLFRNGKFKTFSTKDGLSSDKIRCLFTDKEGTVWAGTREGGLIRFRDGNFTNFTTKDGLTGANVICISQDQQGDLWVGTDSGGLNRFRNGEFTAFTTKDGLSNDAIRSLFYDRDGNLWIGTEAGVDRMKNGRFSNFTRKEGLDADMVISIYEDREKNLWLGTFGGGLHQLRDGKFATLTTKDGLSNDWAISLYEDRNGNFWIGTYGGGVNKLHAGSVTTISSKNGLLNDQVLAFADDQKGSIWIGTYGGLNRWNDGKLSVLPTKDGPFREGTGVYVDHEGTLWLSTDSGAVRWRNGEFTRFTVADGLLDSAVYFFYEDRSQNLWICTSGGLNLFRDGKLMGFKEAQGFTNDSVYCVYEDATGDLWIGTGSGLFRRRNGKFSRFTTTQGLMIDGISSILEDDHGNLWMGSNRGVFRVRKTELNDVAEGKIRTVTSVSYGLADGMKSLECTSGTQPAAWKAHDGKLWYATGGGVSVIDPQRIPHNDLIPPVRIEELVVDGETLPVGAGSAPVVFRPGTKNLEFRYTALSFRVPERVKFRYKMEGYDQNWVDAGTRRVAYYTNLSPHDYRFRVIACNDDRVWNEAGVDFAFVLKPYFYQTRYFYGLCILVAVAIGFGAQRLRVKRLKKLVETRTHELSKANQKLLEAQERITKLLEVQPQVLEDISAWSQSVAKDIAQVVGAGGISIWVREGEGFRSWGEANTRPPSLDEVKRAWADTANAGMVPVTGSTGQILGVLTVAGGKVVWGETEKRLISGLANQLGSALEMQRMRQDLASAHQKRAATIQQLHDQGISTVQVCPHCGRCYDHRIVECPADQMALQIPQILPFKILDRYRLTRLLGQGGTGTVYQAQDEKLKRFVAVKILRKEFLDDPVMKDRWEREAHMVARLHHPGIVDLHDVGELADGSAFLVMEFLEGVDLARILKAQGPANPSQVADVLEHVGSALSGAHAAGVIHRDLKPANLFLMPGHHRFQVKVVDFGIAKLIREETTITRTGVLLGSPSYMSPEQIRGQQLDQRSDLFSLAAVTYELLTGNVAFSAESIPEVFMHVLVDQPVPIPDAELNQMISWALQKDSNKRPPTVASWVQKMVPLLLKSASDEHGWRLSELRSELAMPVDRDTPTEQL